ncbi:5-hydroxyisourate hydrolase [Abditibacteriota bacterium]|nr:5-hydroxyisourate hydrolase [Abditibacteriota bacterium]
MNGLTTHILDISRGLPAPQVRVRLEQNVENEWRWISEALTDGDGRARLRSAEETFDVGTYRLTFEVAPYFESLQIAAFYPFIQVVFTVHDTRHHHVPLLLGPFGYSTYRGS